MNTQRMTLDLSKKHSTKPTVYVGRGDRGGTRLLATITNTVILLTLGYTTLIAPLVAYAQRLGIRVERQDEIIDELAERFDRLEA